MAIDTALKRRAALGMSVLMLPPADTTIDEDDRAILLHLYLLFESTTIVPPFCWHIESGYAPFSWSLEERGSNCD